MLFLSIPYDPGWTATVDGKKVKPEIVNMGFMGLIIEPGAHRVDLEYRLPYFFSSLLTSIFAIVVYFLLIAYRILKNNKKA